MEACVGLPAGPAVVAVVIRLPKLMTHTKFRSCSSAAASRAGLVPVRDFRVARHTNGSSNRDERQEAAPRRCAGVSQNGAPGSSPPPLGHVVVRRPTVVSPTSHIRKTVIRRTPATEPLEGTLDVSAGLVGHRVDMRGTVLGPALAWAGAGLGAVLQGRRNGRCEDPTRCASQQRISDFRSETIAQK